MKSGKVGEVETELEKEEKKEVVERNLSGDEEGGI